MKNTFQKRLAAAVLILFVFFLSGYSVYADAIGDHTPTTGDDNISEWNDDWNTYSGKCGDSMEWVLDNSNSSLTISGSGEMWSRTSHGNDLWSVSEIKSISFTGNIQSVGAGAFSGCKKLASVALPKTVKKIGENAFEGCTALARVELANTVEKIGGNSFAGCSSLTDVYFTGSRQDWLFLIDGVQTGLNSSVNMHYASTVSVTSQPVNVKVSADVLAHFSVEAEGKGTLSYQWFFKKKGAQGWSTWNKHTTATTAAISNDTWDGMQVYCRIEDSENYVSSDLCEITLLKGVSIISHPSNVTVNTGEEVSFTVKAQGSGLKYQWYYKKAGASTWSLWKAHTSATTVARANDTWDGMQVYCKVSDSSGSVANSKSATIKLNGMPKITAQPSDVTVNSGEEVSFTVKAQGDTLNYQWYFKKSGAAVWSVWKSHTTATTVARANDTWDGMQVYCVVSDTASGSSVSSQPATIKLSGMPKIIVQPSNVTVKAGGLATFAVNAQGSNLKYQWYFMKRGADCWSLWKSHTTASTSARSNDSWDGMQVYCVITDGFGRTVSSNPATIKITQ